MSSELEEITVRYKGKDPLIFQLENGVLSMQMLQKIYSNAAGLTCQKDGKYRIITIKDDNLQVLNDVKVYDVYIDSTRENETPLTTMSKKKTIEFQDALACIKKGCSSEMKDEMRKESERVKIGKKKKAERFIDVGWKHRDDFKDNYVQMQKPSGGKRRLKLDLSVTYTLDDIKKLAIDLFKSDLTKNYFTQSLIYLGKFDNSYIFNFIPAGASKEDFWAYSPALYDKGSRLNLYIFTTYVKGVHTDVDNTKKSIENSSLLHDSYAYKISKQMFSIQPKPNTPSTSSGKFPSTNCTTEIPSSSYSLLTAIQPKNSVQKSRYDPKKDAMLLQSKKSSTIHEKSTLKRKADVLSSHNSSELNERNVKSNKLTPAINEKSNLRKSDVSHNSFGLKDNYLDNARSSYQSTRSPLKNKINVDNINVTIPTITEIPFKDLLFFKDDKLGRGSFGTVVKGSWSDTTVAIKSMDMFCSRPKEIIKEVAILKQISHENIVQIMGVCHNDMQFHIVMELVDGNNLKDIIFNSIVRSKFNLNEDKKNVVGQQICKAISFMHLHPKQILHRDIKPANILLSYDLKVKICDLGLAKIKNISSQLMTTQGRRSAPGTTVYMAPEILLHKFNATTSSDVWSLGCTLLEFYNNHLVWDLQSSNPSEELKKLLKKETMPDIGFVPIFLKPILRKCFDYKSVNRPQASEIFKVYQRYNNCKNAYQ